MDLKSILDSKNFNEPPEIKAVKDYVAQHFDGRSVSVSLTPTTIIITVSSAAFAGSLKNQLTQLKRAVATDKLISLRIG